jgi:hypothetical protein
MPRGQPNIAFLKPWKDGIKKLPYIDFRSISAPDRKLGDTEWFEIGSEEHGTSLSIA